MNLKLRASFMCDAPCCRSCLRVSTTPRRCSLLRVLTRTQNAHKKDDDFQINALGPECTRAALATVLYNSPYTHRMYTKTIVGVVRPCHWEAGRRVWKGMSADQIVEMISGSLLGFFHSDVNTFWFARSAKIKNKLGNANKNGAAPSSPSFRLLLFLLFGPLFFETTKGFTNNSPTCSLTRGHSFTCHPPQATARIRHVSTGVREIVVDYDVFLLDMWGVLHDGTQAYTTGVLQALQELKTRNKKMIVLSNSSKRKANSVRALTRLGFDVTSFQEIITSGEVSHNLLSSSSSPSTNKQWWSTVLQEGKDKKAILLGNEDDVEFCQECGWQCTESVDEATLIIARGTFTIHTTQQAMIDKRIHDTYDEALATILEAASKRRLPMLVANPDKIRLDASLSPMPGAIGEAYRKLLGKDDADNLVVSIGKPFAEVYERALQNCDDLSRVCMVGDALETDTLGGNTMGFDTVWVLKDGVYANSPLEPEEILAEFNNNSHGTYARGKPVVPTICMQHFRW